MSSLVCASSASRLILPSHSPTRRCAGKACATRAAQSPSRKESVFFVHRLRLWTCQININLTKISMRCRTEFRATCSSIYVIWALQFFPSTFGHRPLFFFVDTCCVWGGFGRFRPASTWRHNPVPFISQVPGGYYTGNTPPFIGVFALFYFRLLQTANRRPRPLDSYTILLRPDGSSQDSSSVVNGRFFVDSCDSRAFLA